MKRGSCQYTTLKYNNRINITIKLTLALNLLEICFIKMKIKSVKKSLVKKICWKISNERKLKK